MTKKKMKKCCSAMKTDGVGLLYTSSNKTDVSEVQSPTKRIAPNENQSNTEDKTNARKTREKKRTEHSRLCVCIELDKYLRKIIWFLRNHLENQNCRDRARPLNSPCSPVEALMVWALRSVDRFRHSIGKIARPSTSAVVSPVL